MDEYDLELIQLDLEVIKDSFDFINTLDVDNNRYNDDVRFKIFESLILNFDNCLKRLDNNIRCSVQ